jgi:glycosyltransferase involved in cell wall biosynthesis
VIYNAVPAPGSGEGECGSASAVEACDPTERFERTARDEPPEPIELLYVGAAGPRKRVLALPFVLESVRRTHPGARLRLVGFELEKSPELAQLFAERGLADAVLCEGVHTSEGVRRFYRAAQVLLVPSIYEGLPMVILEAQRSGLPCVATRVSGHPEVIEDGVNGFLVEPDDPIQMAERCALLLGDEGRRNAFATAGRTVVAERFSIERQCAGYLDLYAATVGPAETAGPVGPAAAVGTG